MMIGKNGLAANGNPPIPEIAEERIRIAETAERKKWAGADFVGGEQGDLSAKPAKPKQSSGCGENRILVELPDCKKRLSEPDNHGRFAGAADGKIANADNRSFQTLLLQPGVRIEPNPHPHNCPVHDR